MTINEALTEIQERVRVTEYVDSSYVDCVDIEALRVAIEALEQQEQLDEWLEQLKRADTLLTATHDLLQKQYKNICVLNLLAETINYDEAECDGNCLMEDIEAWMIERGIVHDDDE